MQRKYQYKSIKPSSTKHDQRVPSRKDVHNMADLIPEVLTLTLHIVVFTDETPEEKSDD